MLSISNTVCYHEDVYFIIRSFSGCVFCRYSNEDRRYYLLQILDSSDKFAYFLLYILDSKIYMLPHMADDLMIYDINDKFFEKVKIGNDDKKKNVVCKYYGEAIENIDKVYFAGVLNSSILCMDKRTHSLVECMNNGYGYDNKFEVPSVGGNTSVVGNMIYIPMSMKDTIFVYDMDKNEGKYVIIGDIGLKINTITFDGTYLWLTGDKEYLVRWTPQSGDYKIYTDVFPQTFTIRNEGNYLFVKGERLNKFIIYFPYAGNMILRFDTKKIIFEKICFIDENHTICFVSRKNSENAVSTQLVEEGSLDIKDILSICSDGKYISDTKFLNPAKDLIEFDDGFWNSLKYVKESELINLSNFLSEQFKCRESTETQFQNVGKHIYHCI